MTFILDVYHILNMKNNILSLGQLLKEKHMICTENNFLELRNSQGKLIPRVRMTKNRIFLLYLNSKSEYCLTSIINSETEQ